MHCNAIFSAHIDPKHPTSGTLNSCY